MTTSHQPKPSALVLPSGISRHAVAVNFLLRHVLKRHIARNGLNAKSARKVVHWIELLTMELNKSAAVERKPIGGVPCDVIHPPRANASQANRRVVLYLHGGGFFVHLPNSYQRFAKRIAKSSGATVYLPDYRLAPEHRFPRGADDCLAVYRALLADGCDPGMMTVMGDSAGGNLALVTLLRARDEGLPLPACATLLSPGADLTFSGASFITNAKADPMIPMNALHEVARQYVDAGDKSHPHVSPMMADFTGLPPLKIVVGSTEVLLDSSVSIAQSFRATGGNVVLHIWHQMPHVFPIFHFLPESRMAMRNMVDFFHRHTTPLASTGDKSSRRT